MFFIVGIFSNSSLVSSHPKSFSFFLFALAFYFSVSDVFIFGDAFADVVFVDDPIVASPFDGDPEFLEFLSDSSFFSSFSFMSG